MTAKRTRLKFSPSMNESESVAGGEGHADDGEEEDGESMGGEAGDREVGDDGDDVGDEALVLTACVGTEDEGARGEAPVRLDVHVLKSGHWCSSVVLYDVV